MSIHNLSNQHIYYNASYTNTTSTYQQAQNSFQLTQALLPKCNDYRFSIIKWSVAGYLIPIFIFPQPSQPNYSQVKFSVAIKYNGIFYEQDLVYTPWNAGYQPYLLYWYIYSYQQFIQMLNTAIYNAFQAFKTAIPAFGGTYAPYFVLNEGTELISCYYEQAYWDSSYASTYPRLWINVNVQNLMQCLPAYSFPVGYENSPDLVSQWSQLLFMAQGSGNLQSSSGNQQIYLYPPSYLNYSGTTPGTIVGNYTMQDYPCLEAWLQAEKIVITSSLIPVRAENFPSITVVQGNSQGSPSTRQILSDYDLNSVKGGDVRSIIHYIPTAQYQFYDLLSTSPLYNVDFQFWWVDASLTFYPLYINPNETCILKLLFVKKDDKESEPIIGYGM